MATSPSERIANNKGRTSCSEMIKSHMMIIIHRNWNNKSYLENLNFYSKPIRLLWAPMWEVWTKSKQEKKQQLNTGKNVKNMSKISKMMSKDYKRKSQRLKLKLKLSKIAYWRNWKPKPKWCIVQKMQKFSINWKTV